MSWHWLAYPLLGSFAGFIAGLFGVGGGLMLVPLLFMLFAAQGIAEAHLMHLALGTSMTTIMFTSISSMRAHHRHGAVRWDIVKYMTPGLMLGTLIGTQIASLIPTRPLGIIFTVIVYYAALQMAIGFSPPPSHRLPGRNGLILTGVVIGCISSLVSAGGGFMSVPFMLWCNVAAHQAVGTSSALGFPIAVAGTLGYLFSGWQVAGLPAGTLGYIDLPALAGVVILSTLTAPLGARLAHRLPVKQLKRAFALFLAVLASKMLADLLA
ncbi:MAG: sulfite exporter TauE/SafE family protein [Sterolibacterium sp.]|jgi:uncharacterized membrane protein YfcA|nr:sulfite exporter TauE/SafE family protein [Sterolibacterium sp.]